MKPILEYIISNSTKKYLIKATNDTIKQIVKDELDRLGHDAKLNHIDVSKVTNMDSLFSCDSESLGSEYTDLNPDISRWNVSNVENMHLMFFECYDFNCDISRWNVHKVEDMSDMFSGCKNFNQDISGWDVSKVKDMWSMFNKCKNFNQDLSQWDVSNCEAMYGMFSECENFNQDISKWDVSKVKNHDYIFYKCHIIKEWRPKFKKLRIS